MKTLLRILGGLAVLVFVLLVVAFLFPRSYQVERSIIIRAAPQEIFGHVGNLRAWKNWSAWHERDPSMKLSFSEQTSGVGAWSAWESDTEGSGRMTIMAYEPPKRLEYRLEFPDMNMVSSGAFELTPVSAGVRTVWRTEGELGMNPIHRWFGLFLDRMIGADFDHGLGRLKLICEGSQK